MNYMKEKWDSFKNKGAIEEMEVYLKELLMNYSMSREPNDYEIKAALNAIKTHAKTSQLWATYRDHLKDIYQKFGIQIVNRNSRAKPYDRQGEEYNPYLIIL